MDAVPKKLETADTVAPMLGLSKQALYDAVRQKLVPAVYIGRRVDSTLTRWLSGLRMAAKQLRQRNEPSAQAASTLLRLPAKLWSWLRLAEIEYLRPSNEHSTCDDNRTQPFAL